MNRFRQYGPIGCFAIAALGAGALLAAAMDTITTPDESDGIQPSFAFHPDIPFQSLKEVPIWNEVSRMLDTPYALVTCPSVNGQVAGGNAQGYPATCTTIARRRSFLPAGCTYDPSTGLPPCNDALLRPFLVHPLNYNPFTGEQMRVMRPGTPFTVGSRVILSGKSRRPSAESR